MKHFVLFFFILMCIDSFAQHKQANTSGAELIADAPARMKKNDASGNANGIPIFIYIHDSNNSTSKIDLIGVKISIKNANVAEFNPPITFQDYQDNAFQNLISCKSVYDSYFDIQHFDSSSVAKDYIETIKFTKDTNWWMPPIPMVFITHTHWYFMFTIPPEKLVGYNNIIDISVEFNLDYDISEWKHLRIFRFSDSLPALENWYKGDTHFHTMNTQNNAELGFPLEASRVAAKAAGLSWITTTDHSCDFDNYGTSMYLNWQKLGEQVQMLNAESSDFVYIRGIEMSIDNSAGNIVHALVYPPPENPFNLTYMGDGGGDLIGTNISVTDVLSSLSQLGGFAYAAHPFAEGDKLSAMVGGGVWNLSNKLFPVNGLPFPSGGIVGCNDTLYASDIFSNNSNFIFSNRLLGGQIMNLRNIIQTIDEPYDPWNVSYSSVVPFAIIDSLDPLHFYKRFKQNMDVTEFLWRRSLLLKNKYHELKNWKFFISSGSDSHGSFNYSNTDFTLEITGNVNDNAIGKLFTLTYCPIGMGSNGAHILTALKNGNTVLSDGPALSISISHDNTNLSDDIIIGQDTVLNINQLQEYYLVVKAKSSEVYGSISFIKLHIYTQDSVFTRIISAIGGTQVISLSQVLGSMMGSILVGQYFMLTAELETRKDYGSLADIYKLDHEKFHCFTNPIYLKMINLDEIIKNQVQTMKIYPNPGKNRFIIDLNADAKILTGINVYDIFMKKKNKAIFNKLTSGKIELILPDNEYTQGIYFVEIETQNHRFISKIIKE